MNEEIISCLCFEYFGKKPQSVSRCEVGIGNCVYIVKYSNNKYVVRCSKKCNAYDNTIYWLGRLSVLDIPVSKVVGRGNFQEYTYIILTYIQGKDIGLVYQELDVDEKKKIAKGIVEIQNKVAKLDLENIDANWKWNTFIEYILERAKERIEKNGYFDTEKVECLWGKMEQFNEYFVSVKPTAYLDDISSKNLLIYNGQISGIIDIDWIGIGDKLTYVALTNMALLNLEYDTDYVDYILEEMQPTDIQKNVFIFYTLMYCVDFMGERGMQFMDKMIEVNEQIINRLNLIYDMLWNQLP